MKKYFLLPIIILTIFCLLGSCFLFPTEPFLVAFTAFRSGIDGIKAATADITNNPDTTITYDKTAFDGQVTATWTKATEGDVIFTRTYVFANYQDSKSGNTINGTLTQDCDNTDLAAKVRVWNGNLMIFRELLQQMRLLTQGDY